MFLPRSSAHHEDGIGTGRQDLRQLPDQRPVFRGMEVPEVLRSGDHRAIQAWRRAQSLLNTYAKRPDLLERAALTPEDRQVLNQFSRGGDA